MLGPEEFQSSTPPICSRLAEEAVPCFPSGISAEASTTSSSWKSSNAAYVLAFFTLADTR